MATPADPAPFPVRTLTDAEWPALVDVDSHAFGATFDAEVLDSEREMLEAGRTIGTFDGPTLVGIATAFSLDLTVPGAVVPAAGVSWVSVLPTHRRRGVLRGLMTHQLYDVRERGREPLAILWASEPPIYGRFGYGSASRALRLAVPRDAQALRDDTPADPDLRLRLVDPEEWKLTADVYARAAATRPGMLARDDRWHRRAVRDVPSQRHGRSALRCVVAEDASGVRGYARYATKPDWSSGRPQGTVDVREVVASDAAAAAAVYRYLLDLDLMGTVELWNVPVDDPLVHWLRDPRRARPSLGDALYVRVVDLPAALSARTYAAPVDVVLQVEDPLCPWNDGRWRLRGGPEGATCEPSEALPDLALHVTELGAVYLGGTTLAELALAGRVAEQRPGALLAASVAFTSSPMPWCPVVF